MQPISVPAQMLQIGPTSAALQRCIRYHDTVETVATLTVTPALVHQPFAAIVIMEQRGSKPEPFSKWVLTRVFNAWCGDQVVGAIFIGTVQGVHIGVNQPEQTISIGQAWRPRHRIINAAHVELTDAIEWTLNQTPVHQVFAVMIRRRNHSKVEVAI